MGNPQTNNAIGIFFLNFPSTFPAACSFRFFCSSFGFLLIKFQSLAAEDNRKSGIFSGIIFPRSILILLSQLFLSRGQIKTAMSREITQSWPSWSSLCHLLEASDTQLPLIPNKFKRKENGKYFLLSPVWKYFLKNFIYWYNIFINHFLY